MSARCALVTGATGAVGPAVVRRLSAAGYAVRVFAKASDPCPEFGCPVDLRAGDVLDVGALRDAALGVDVVVHMAALLHEIDRASAADDYRRVNVQGTANTLAVAREAGVGRMVMLSTIAVYGDLNGAIADESTPARPDTPYGETKLTAEQLVLAATRDDGRPLGVVLRAGAVYGPRVKGNYRRLVLALHSRRFIPVGTGANRRSLVFDEDLAEAVLLALDTPAAAGGLFNVTDGEYHPVSSIVAAICEALGKRPPRLFLPFALAMVACRAAEAAWSITGRTPPVRAASLRKYVEDVAVSSARIRQALGFRPRYDLESGWQATVEGLRATGDL